jgi:hypothetical protein
LVTYPPRMTDDDLVFKALADLKNELEATT